MRHGESAWNRENRFTGWTDVDLTDKGVEEALKAGELLKAEGFRFGKAYTSYLKRAVRTLNCVLDRLDQEWIPVEKKLAPQRETLRRTARAQQERNGGPLRRRAGAHLAAQLRRRTRSAGRRRSPQSALRSPLRRDPGRGAAPHRIAQANHRTGAALLAMRDFPRTVRSRRNLGGSARQQPAGYHQTPERHLRRGDLGTQPPDGRAIRLRIRRQVTSGERLLSGRSRTDPQADGSRSQSGQKNSAGNTGER